MNVRPAMVGNGRHATFADAPHGSDARRASRLIFIALFGFYLFILLVLRGPDNLLWDPDVYWHVAVGRNIWQMGAVPQIEVFSYTFQGHPWMAKDWLGDLFLYGAYALAGWRGVALLTASTAALSFALLFLVLSRKLRLTVALGAATVACGFSTAHFDARPQIFADPLIILWVSGLVRAVENRTSPNWLLLPIIILWANVHASFTFGVAIGAALAAEACLESEAGERLRMALRWGIFLVAAIVCGCMTPYGYRSILITFQVFGGNESLAYITEFRPMTLQSLGMNGFFVLALLIMIMYYGIRIPFWRLLTTVGLIYMMFAHIRFVSLFAILTPILLATPLARQFPFLNLTTQLKTDPQFFKMMARASRAAFQPLSTLIAAGAILFGVYGPPVSPKAYITPAGAVDYIYKEHLTGNIYNFYDFGGYLIFRGIKTFIDGRADQLFQQGFMDRLYGVITKHPRKLLPLLSEYDVSIALVTPDSIEAQEFASSTDWEKIYSDDISELFKKRDAEGPKPG